MYRHEIIDFGERLHMENEKLKHQGYRNDCAAENIKASLETLSHKYGKSKRTISRYVRVHYFSNILKDCYIKGNIDFKAAVELSYLEFSIQDLICSSAERNITLEDAKLLRSKVNSGNVEEIKSILGVEKQRRYLPGGAYLIKKYNLIGYSDSDLLILLDCALQDYLIKDGKIRWH